MMRELARAIHAFARLGTIAALAAALATGGLTATAYAGGRQKKVRLARSGAITRVVPRYVPAYSYRSYAVATPRVVRVPVRRYVRTTRVRPARVYRYSSPAYYDPFCAVPPTSRSTYLARRYSGHAYRAPIYSGYRSSYAYAGSRYP